MKLQSIAYKSIAIILACLMITTSTDLAVDFHFCGGKVKSFSFLGEAPNCHEMAKKTMSCCSSRKKKEVVQKSSCGEKKGCCHNELFHFQSDNDDQVQPSNLITQIEIDFAGDFNSDLTYLFPTHKKGLSAFKHYKPPLIRKNIPVLHQSFLL